jgi:hypothetical protein
MNLSHRLNAKLSAPRKKAIRKNRLFSFIRLAASFIATQ